MLLNIFIVLLLLWLITLIVIQNKNKKNIWQKISFLYNQLYINLIYMYYNDLNIKKDILKDEIIDYYNSIVKTNDTWKKYSIWQELRQFIIQYDNSWKSSIVYNIIDKYYNDYYYNISKFIIVLYVIVTILCLILLYKNI